jgi:hypothetical protein
MLEKICQSHLQTKVLLAGAGLFAFGFSLYQLLGLQIIGAIIGFGGILGSMFIVQFAIKRPVKKKSAKVEVNSKNWRRERNEDLQL